MIQDSKLQIISIYNWQKTQNDKLPKNNKWLDITWQIYQNNKWQITKKFQITQNDKILNMKNWDQLKMKSNKRLKNINTHTAGSISSVFWSCIVM